MEKKDFEREEEKEQYVDHMFWALRNGNFEEAAANRKKFLELANNLDFKYYVNILFEAGNEGNVEVCKLLLNWLEEDFKNRVATLFGHPDAIYSIKKDDAANSILQGAAFGNKKEACIFAKEQGADHFVKMLEFAAKGAHKEMCELAREWAKPPFRGAQYQRMYWIAREQNNVELIRLAYEWGAIPVITDMPLLEDITPLPLLEESEKKEEKVACT